MLVKVKESLVENFYGFYGTKRRYPGDQFTLVEQTKKNGDIVSVDDQFSDKWMEKVEPEKKEVKKAPVKTKSAN